MREDFRQWAYSFSGCDGGDPSSDIWLCGIEWGYENATEEERQNYYRNELPLEIRNGRQELKSSYNFFIEESMAFPFNLAFSKIHSSIINNIKPNILNKTDNILKLNLSPIAFRKDHHSLWNENLKTSTGFAQKSKFIEYMIGLSRFKPITEEFKPKLIICVGVDSRNDFKNAFFGKGVGKIHRLTIRPEERNKNQNNRYIYHAQDNGTTLVVVPFSTSSNGLNSDYLLNKTGKKIVMLLNNGEIGNV